MHKGTGAQTVDKLLVVTDSVVPGSGKLTFVTRQVRYRTFLYELDDDSIVPNWFGVTVPEGITDFTRPTLYFHPTPGQAGYVDADYREKKGKWPSLFAYMDRLGAQVAGAVSFGGSPDQVVIMPFMKEGASGTAGIFPVHWKAIVRDILRDVRAQVAGIDAPVDPSTVVVASYSSGFLYSSAFRQSADGLSALLEQVWDFDGFPKNMSSALVSVPGKFRAVKYAEGVVQQALALPRSRWDNVPQPPPDEEPNLPKEKHDNGTINDVQYVHHLIRDFMFLHATWQR